MQFDLFKRKPNEVIEKVREITAEFSYDRKLEQIRDIVNQFPPPEADNEIPSL